MDQDSKIAVFGGSGLLGRAICKVLDQQGYSNISSPSHDEVDLLQRDVVIDYLADAKPDNIFMVAGLVGGIQRNRAHQANFLYDNSMMALNLLESSRTEVPNSRLLYTGATCVYPKNCPQPIKEESFLSGKLEETSIGYAAAKILGIIGFQKYNEQHGLDTVCAMPTSLYGLGDNYNLEEGHQIAGLIKRFLEAKKSGDDIILWGSGKPRREALYSEDCANSLIHLMNSSSNDLVNVGMGRDYSIKEFAETIGEEIGFTGRINWDTSKPDGTYQKLTDNSRFLEIYPGFKPMRFKEGLSKILNDGSEVQRILSS
ncbi:MAG: NAD-dependent epimerase/dehydratase family protein [Nanoarchaeota archaeon]|nr:NAD-dependent epimerase/dehydratase family protein [Nanoarchaeota archaeon]